jgi:hypothetical protein
MDIFSQFSVVWELLRREALEQTLMAIDDLRSIADHRLIVLGQLLISRGMRDRPGLEWGHSLEDFPNG